MATVLYVETHQDDLALSMGASARKHLEVGHDVHVLLLCGGINSGVQPNSGLSRSAFGAARDEEWHRANRAIGIRPENMYQARVSMPDGELTVSAAYDAIAWFCEKHPGTWLKAYSYLDATGKHCDHLNTGQAAYDIVAEGLADNLRCYVEPWLVPQWTREHPDVRLGQESAGQPEFVRAGLQEYKTVDPAGGKFGIGFKSMGAKLDAIMSNPVSYVHLPIGV